MVSKTKSPVAKVAEEALRASEARYRDLMEGIDVAVYTTDAAGRITLYNEAAVRLWGRRPEVGVDEWCGSWRLHHLDGTPMAHEDCPMAITLKENRPLRGEVAIAERPDGSRVFFMPFPTPLRDASGALVGAVNVMVDVSEHKRAEAEAEGQRELVKAITQNMSVGLLMIDNEGRIEFMNPAAEKITGYRFDDVRGQVKHDLLHYKRPDGTPYPESECPINGANKSAQRVTGLEEVFVRPNGTLYHVLCNVAPVLRDGITVGAVVDLRDATEEKKAEEAIKHSMAIKDQFLSLVSHELRTPISTIVGNALLILRRGGTLPQDDRDQALLDVANESQKLQRIIENLLLLARMDADEPLDSEPIRLGQLITQAVASFQRRHPRRVNVSAEGDVPIVLGQNTMLSLVIDNLLSNAAKYSPTEAPIDITVRSDGGDDVKVIVSDCGIGLEPEEAENIFTPFYRSPKAKTQAKGIGLGLAVCKRIVEAHGGQIRADSRPEGGCDFMFSLPSAPDSLV
ncbi:MAG: PAS domain-containing sensor histidine kinase [Dehalococcoidia bacterium]